MIYSCLIPLSYILLNASAVTQIDLQADMAENGIVGWLPSSLKRHILPGMYLWQHMALLLLLLGSVIVYGMLCWVFKRTIRHFANRWTYPNNLIAVSPLSISLVSFLVIIILPLVQLPMAAERCLILLARGLIAFALTYLSYRLVDLLDFYLQQRGVQKDSQVTAHLLPLLRKAAKVLVVSIGTLWIMQSLNFDTKALLAGFSIGGVAFALASQDTLKNLFGSLMILIDRPFSVGDVIASGALEGKVEEVGLRSTRLRTTQGSVIYVPNAKLADAPIDNYGPRRHRRFFVNLIIAYDTPPALIEIFVKGLRQMVCQHPYVVKDRCFIYLNDLKESKLEVLVHIYFRIADYRKELQGRHEILLSIIKLVRALSLSLAGPLQASYPEYTRDPAALQQRLQTFLDQNYKKTGTADLASSSTSAK